MLQGAALGAGLSTAGHSEPPVESKAAVTSLVLAALSSAVGAGICGTNCGGCGTVKFVTWQNSLDSV